MNDMTEDEWKAWQLLTPQERFRKSAEYLQQFLAMGGSLDPDYDPQSPFNNDYYPDGPPVDEPQYVYLKRSDNRAAMGEEIDRDCADVCGESEPVDEDLFKPSTSQTQLAREQARRQIGMG